jgi:hypothetical protein
MKAPLMSPEPDPAAIDLAALVGALRAAVEREETQPIFALTLPRSATALGISLSSLKQKIAAGALPTINISGRRLCRLEDLAAVVRDAPRWGEVPGSNGRGPPVR